MNTETSIRRIRIDNTDVFLEDMGIGKGKITISDTYDHNYSYFWGSMGGNLDQFITSIDSGYFSDKLMGYKSNYVMDVKKTFATIRKHIRQEILPWYDHMEFQKGMRDILNNFQSCCEEYNDRNYFVSVFFSSFVDRLPYWDINNKYERESIEKSFKGISEQWHFIEDKPSKEYMWLAQFHKKLIKELKDERSIATTEPQS